MSPDNLEILFSKAREIFISRGYHGTSIRMLASELNISEKEFYDLLTGKKALAKKLISQEESRWESVFKKAHEGSHSDGKEELKAVIDIVLKSHLEEISPKGSLLPNLSCELSHRDQEIQQLIAHAYNALVSKIAELLQGIEKRDRSHNDREVALFILGAIEGSIILAKSDNDFWEMKNGFEMTKQFIENL